MIVVLLFAPNQYFLISSSQLSSLMMITNYQVIHILPQNSKRNRIVKIRKNENRQGQQESCHHVLETYSMIYLDSKFAENTTKSRAEITSPESRHMDGFTTYSTCSRLRIILHIRSEREDPSRLISNTLIPGEQTFLHLNEFDYQDMPPHNCYNDDRLTKDSKTKRCVACGGHYRSSNNVSVIREPEGGHTF